MARPRTSRCRGARILLEAPKPVFQSPPYRRSEAYNRYNVICKPGTRTDRAMLETYREPVLAVFRRWATVVPNVLVRDPFTTLCPHDEVYCDPFSDGRPPFFDADHLGQYGNEVLLPSFMRAVAATPIEQEFDRSRGEPPSSGRRRRRGYRSGTPDDIEQ